MSSRTSQQMKQI
jgi:hypothetical protein